MFVFGEWRGCRPELFTLRFRDIPLCFLAPPLNLLVTADADRGVSTVAEWLERPALVRCPGFHARGRHYRSTSANFIL